MAQRDQRKHKGSHRGAPAAADGPGAERTLATVVGDWPTLVQLFMRADPRSMSHWDPTTGEVFDLPRGKQREATALRFEQRLWRETGWVEIPCQESDAAYREAVAFVEALRPGRGRTELLAALQGPKPFRALRSTLERHPGLKRRWMLQASAEATLRLVEFCLSQGWRLSDPRFDEAVEAWLDATEPEPEAGTITLGPVQRPLASLSIGQPKGAIVRVDPHDGAPP